MNVFALDEDPRAAARMLCDIHMQKMLLETAQILCTAAEKLGIEGAPYRGVQHNNKCIVWAGRTPENFLWLCRHGIEMHAEYMRRRGKGHGSFSAILWASRLDLDGLDFQSVGLTPFAAAVWPPMDGGRHPDPDAAEMVLVYRGYYARKEEVWANNARAHAMERANDGKSATKGQKPVMEWREPGMRPDWMPQPRPDWRDGLQAA